MYEIDKKKFGAFVSQLRREKGYTQKELAEKLYISDKAVSKWETGMSIPDTGLLIPLAELLGVTVTELLMCERMEENETMDARQVDSIVRTAVNYSWEKTARAYQKRSLWWVLYFCALFIGGIGLWYSISRNMMGSTMPTCFLLSAIFGAYFCFLVKTRLPQFYDDNRFGLYYDSGVRMNVPGVALNNSNWPHIVRVVRIWACLLMTLYPLLNIVMNCINPGLWRMTELYIGLALMLGGLFIPVYVVGRKYE